MDYNIIYKIFLRFVKEKIGDGTIPIYIQHLINRKILNKINYQSWLNNQQLIWDNTKKNKAFWYKVNYEWVSILSSIDKQNLNEYKSYKLYLKEKLNKETTHAKINRK